MKHRELPQDMGPLRGEAEALAPTIGHVVPGRDEPGESRPLYELDDRVVTKDQQLSQVQDRGLARPLPAADREHQLVLSRSDVCIPCGCLREAEEHPKRVSETSEGSVVGV